MIFEIREVIRAILKEQCQNSYYRRAPKSAPFPRIVFSLDLYEEEGVQRGTLTTDLYDDEDDTERIEQIADAIRAAFHRKLLIAGKTRCACYYDRVLVLEDEDKDLNRRQLQFEVRVYEG